MSTAHDEKIGMARGLAAAYGITDFIKQGLLDRTYRASSPVVLTLVTQLVRELEHHGIPSSYVTDGDPDLAWVEFKL